MSQEELAAQYDSSTWAGAHEASKYTINGDIDTLEGNELGKTFVVAGNAVVLIDRSQMKVHYGNEYTPGSYEEENAVESMGGVIPKYTVFDGQVAEKAYYQGELTHYVIPSGVTRIGDYAFANSKLENIVIPNTVTTIGYCAFENCENLSYVTIPDSVSEIDARAFDGTQWKNSWMQGGDSSPFYIVGDGILLFYKGSMTSVTIPDQVKQIAAGVFRDHTEIESVTMPDGLKVIGEEAFMGCTSLTEINGGSYLTQIKDRAFFDCPLDTIRIPATVTELGVGAYDVTAKSRENAFGAVFMGSTLPTLSYETSATHLSNKENRVKALNGVQVAVLWNGSATNLETSVLGNKDLGFSGFICKVQSEAVGENKGVLELLAVTDAENLETIPDNVWVYGKRYSIQDPNQIFTNAKNRTEEDTYSFAQDGKQTISVVEVPATEQTEAFVLREYQDEEAEQKLVDRLKNYYGDNFPANVETFSMMAYDDSGTVEISKLDEYAMKVTKNAPAGMSGDKMQVVTVDKEGQMEDVPISVSEDGRQIQFDIDHFSPFVMFQLRNTIGNAESEQETGVITDQIENDLLQGQDYVPETQESVSVITIICILAGSFLLIIAMALAFTRKFHKTI